MTALKHVPIALLILSFNAVAQTPPTGRVEGRVVAADGTPVPGATVRITTHRPEVQPPVSYVEVTGPDGTFAVSGVAAEEYNVTAERPGYKAVEFGFVQVSPASKPRIEIAMVRLLSISGRFFDQDGDPVPRVTVQLLRPSDYETLSFSTEATVSADELGQFRISNVVAGHYVLRANPLSQIPAARSREGTLTSVVVGRSAEDEDLPAYYPGAVSDPREATTLRVDAPVQGLELRLPRGRRFTIRGTVLPPDGIDQQRVRVFVRNGWGDLLGLVRTFGDGEFETDRLPPGKYSITASVMTPDDRYASRYGHIDVIVADRDIEELRISMAGPAKVTLTGRVRIEGVDDFEGYVRRTNALFQSPREPNTLLLKATDDYPLAKAIVLKAADTDGVFRVDDAVPARYRLESVTYPLNSYVRQILVNGKEIPNGEIDLTPGDSATLDVVYAIDGGTLAFVVPPGWSPSLPDLTDPVLGTWILLWPMRTETPMPRVVGSRMLGALRIPSPNPKFSPLEHLPPGDYHAALFDELPPMGLSGSARFLRLLDEHASPVTIRSKATTTIQPKVISREQMQRALAGFPRDAKE